MKTKKIKTYVITLFDIGAMENREYMIRLDNYRYNEKLERSTTKAYPIMGRLIKRNSYE